MSIRIFENYNVKKVFMYNKSSIIATSKYIGLDSALVYDDFGGG